MIKQRIEKLRSIMKEKNIYAYIMPSSDYHQSEYVGEYFKSREFISGFTGSAGTVIVTQSEAGLWTDGRYFIQAENELKNSDIKLFKIGEDGVPTVEQYLVDSIPKDSRLGFDGKVICAKEGQNLASKLEFKNISIEYDYDLINNTNFRYSSMRKMIYGNRDVAYLIKRHFYWVLSIQEQVSLKNYIE